MNALLARPFARPCLYIGGLIAAFALGTQVTKINATRSAQRSTEPTSNRKVTALPKPSSTPKSPQGTTQADAKRLPGQLMVATPNSRLASLIDYASKLDATQTLAALRKLDLQPDHPEAKLARRVLVARFAEIDPLTALTYVDTLDGEEHSEQKLNAFAAWASRDAIKASAFFTDNTLAAGLVGDEDVATAATIAGEWAQRDSIAAWRWVSTLPPDARGEAVRQVAGHLAATNPTLALQAVAAMPEAYERAEAMTPLALQWAQTAPNKTAEWVNTLRDPEQQANAATGLVTAWMQSSPMAVSEWVSKLSPGGTRDAAIATMIHAQSVRNDPETATFWAAAVTDETLRNELVSETVRRWEIHDPEAAQRWMAANGR